jgi:hypothetical protein
MTEAEALQLALTATSAPLECLTLVGIPFVRECFSLILKGIRESRSVHCVTLNYCRFDDDSAHLLEDFFAKPTNKRYSFVFAECVSFSKCSSIFFAELFRSNVCLTELMYKGFHHCARDISPISAIATALENDASSVLEKLTIFLESISEFQALAGSLPRMMCLRELNILRHSNTEIPDFNGLLLQALKRNSSLWQISTVCMENWSEAETVGILRQPQQANLYHLGSTRGQNSTAGDIGQLASNLSGHEGG